MVDPALFTVQEVASLMRVSRMTVYRLVHSGEFPSVRVGRSLRIPADAVRGKLESAARSNVTSLPTSRRQVPAADEQRVSRTRKMAN